MIAAVMVQRLQEAEAIVSRRVEWIGDSVVQVT